MQHHFRRVSKAAAVFYRLGVADAGGRPGRPLPVVHRPGSARADVTLVAAVAEGVLSG